MDNGFDKARGARGAAFHRAVRFVRDNAGIGITALLFVAGSAALWRLLSPLNMADVAAHFHALGAMALGQALLATVVGYIALIGYDGSALRYLDKRVPPLKVGLGGFLGYSIGNTIGLSVVSGGAVRYRVYSRFGLSASDVLKVATFAALSYGTCATLLGLAALVVQPGAVAAFVPLSHWSVRVVAGAGFIALGLGLWVLSRGDRMWSIWRWRFRAPGPGLIMRQIVLTGIELLAGAAVMFILLPAGHGPFLGLVVLYAIATMIGILSHVPGGIGVFETVLLAGLPAGLPVAQVLASLLLFRVIYFLVPFCIALALFAFGEIKGFARSRAHCETVILPTGNPTPASSPLRDGAANTLPVQHKDDDMNTVKLATVGVAMLLGTGLTTMASAETETNDAAEMTQFNAHPQSLAQAVAAAEASVDGKAMDAGWESGDAANTGYHVQVAKADGTIVDVLVMADGSTKMMPAHDDSSESGDQDGDAG